MDNYRVVSSDNHVYEPRDLWTSRMEPKYRDRAPHIVRMEDGSDRWFTDGIKGNAAFPGAQTGRRFEAPETLSGGGIYEDVRPGGYIPEEHVKDMDIDGIDVSIVYPTVSLMTYSNVPDSDLFSAICRTYNDWLAEFCGAFPKRLKGIAMLNVDDVEDGVKELERTAKMGFPGAMIPMYPLENRTYDSPMYEPLWAAAQDLQMPLSLHVLTNRPGPGQEFMDLDNVTIAFAINQEYWLRMSLTHMIFSGVFERYPKLQIGAIEEQLLWVPYFLDRIDYHYTQAATGTGVYRFKDDAFPSDFFHRNVFLSFQEDSLGIKLRDVIGVDGLLWGSDYPHQEATWPRSREIIEEILVDCTEEEKTKIVGGNADRIYHLD